MSFELGYSCGANATFSKTIQSDNMTWGYHTPPFPSTWTNHFYLGVGNSRNKAVLSYDQGTLGPTWRVRAYPEKYPFNDAPDSGSVVSNYSTATGFKGGSRTNSSLLKFSVMFEHYWLKSGALSHSSSIGFGFLQTKTTNGSAASGTATYIDGLGFASHSMVMDKYEYFRNQNIYFTIGYKFSYNIYKGLNLNAQIFYNQGFYKMIRWHTYRTYSESATGYTEFDEQWSFTRLSYIAILAGISYEFKFKEKNKK